MSSIPIRVTEKQFNEHILPYLSTAKRGFVCQIALYKAFNYILYRLHTGCQWKQLPIAPDPHDPTKKYSVETVTRFEQIRQKLERQEVAEFQPLGQSFQVVG